MKGMRRALLSILPLAALAGCATAIPPVSVTRFHSDQVARQGSVLVAASNPAVAGSLEFRTIANAVGVALVRTGFTRVDDPTVPHDFIAVVDLNSDTFRPVVTGSPVSVGVGGATGTYGGGVGVGIGIDLSGPPKPVVTTRLHVQLLRAKDQSPMWEGRAETQAKEGTPAAQPGLAAGKLADAVFQGFPGQSGVTISVK